MTDKALSDELGISTRQFKCWRDELALMQISIRMSENAQSLMPIPHPLITQSIISR